MLIADLSDSTKARYLSVISRYLTFLDIYEGIYDAGTASYKEIRDFLGFLEHGDGHGNGGTCNGNTLKQFASIFDFFYTYVLGKPFDRRQYPRFHYTKYLPFIPTREEVIEFINRISNLKLKAYVSLLYSAAMRSDEVQNLFCRDIVHSKGYILIEEAKNRSQRTAYLSSNAYLVLVEYVKNELIPKGLSGKDRHLFPSAWKKYQDTRPVCDGWADSQIAKQEKLQGLPHRFTCHVFRRACACHIAGEHPDDPRMLFILADYLGHNSLESTRHYLVNGQVCNGNPLFFSPFDS